MKSSDNKILAQRWSAHSYRILFDGLNTHPVECAKTDGTHKNLNEVRLAVVDYFRLKAGECVFNLQMNAECPERSESFKLLGQYIDKLAWAATATYMDWFPEEDAKWYKTITGLDLPKEERPAPKNPYHDPAEHAINGLVLAYSDDLLFVLLVDDDKLKLIRRLVADTKAIPDPWIKRCIVTELKRRGTVAQVRDKVASELYRIATVGSLEHHTFTVESLMLLARSDI